MSSALAERRAAFPQEVVQVVHAVTPRYPARYQQARIGGTGRFRMNLDSNTGKVTGVTVVKSTGSDGLDREAIFALRQWRFKPTRLTRVEIPITFHNGSEPLVLPPGAKLVPNR